MAFKAGYMLVVHNNMETEKPKEASKNKSQEGPKGFQFSETLLLAVASAGIYLFAFLYERGYLSFFGIPTQFVTVSLVTLLIFGAATVTLLIFSAGLANMIFLLTPKHRFLAFYIPRYLLMGFFTILIPLYLYGGRRPWLFILCIWIMIMCAFFIFPLIQYRKKGSWAERYDAAMDASIEMDSNDPTSGLYDYLEQRYKVKNLGLWVFILLACVGLASSMGEAEATTQKQFLVLNTIPEMVVLRVSGENIICAPFDRTTHEVKKSFSVLKIAEDSKLIMNLESVGPLKPVEKLTSENIAPSPTPAINTNDNKQ